MRTPQQIADAIITEISRDEMLLKCKTFSELHDYCDANTLGGTDEEMTELPEGSLEEYIDTLNDAQCLVDLWLGARDQFKEEGTA